MRRAGNQGRRVRPCGGAAVRLLAALMLLGSGAARADIDPLTPAEREWLAKNGPVTFASQTEYPPFEFSDENGLRQGMCIDLAQWIAREFGFKAELRDMGFMEAQEAVLSGEADVLTSLFYSKDRDRRFDFTGTTWEVPATIFVRAERPDIRGPDDLRGKRIAIQKGDYASEFLRMKGIPHEEIQVDTFAEAADKVIEGLADVLIGDEPIVLHHLYKTGKIEQLKRVGEPLYVGQNAMAAREGRRELADIMDKGIELARQRGIVDAVTAKWLGTSYAGGEAARGIQSTWLVVGLAVATVVALLLLGWSVHLRKILSRRNEELREAREMRRPVARENQLQAMAWRSLLLLAAMIGLGFGASAVLERFVIMPGYYELERKEAEHKLESAMEAFRREARHLGKLAGDWAAWDDTYQFAEDRNEKYVESNILMENLSQQSQIDAVLIFDKRGQLLVHGAYDPFRGGTMEMDDFAPAELLDVQPLLTHPDPKKARSGILLTGIGPMIFATCAILPGSLEGEPRGTLIMGRFIREELVEELASQLGGTLKLAHPGAPGLKNKQREMFGRMAPGTSETEALADDLLEGNALIGDMDGRPALMLTLELPREIVRQGREAARLLSIVVNQFILAIFAGTVLWFWMSFREASRRQKHVEALVDARTKALRQSEERFQTVFRCSPVPMTISSMEDGQIKDANDAFLEQTGYRREEVFGKTTLEIGLWADMEQRKECMGVVARAGRAQTLPIQIRNKAGEVHDVLWSAEIIEAGGGKYLVTTAMDVTEQKRAAAERERLETQLLQAQKVEAVGRLAGGVAHDFNNMLAVIMGNVEMALEGTKPGQPLHAELTEIRKAAERSSALTRQLLAFARKQAVAPRAFDLNETVEGMLKMLRRLIGEHLSLSWRPGKDAGAVRMDPSQFDQILVNLCVNARDAVGESGTIAIETGEAELDEAACAGIESAVPGRYARLSVADNGCGMDEEMRGHLFEPFYTTKGLGQGTGLGLATVLGAVRQSGGFIGVESARGRGTTFNVYLPRQGESEEKGEAEAEPPATEAGHETVLLVEDEAAILSMMQQLLERRGYKVLAAETPEAAMAAARQLKGRIDLLISDMVMPGMSGRELAKRLAAQHPGMKRLFISGHTADTLSQRGMLGDDAHFIQKPFTMRELEASARAAIEGKAPEAWA